MTALQARSNGMTQEPETADSPCDPPKCTGGKTADCYARECGGCTVDAARKRFAVAVSDGLVELTRRYGYSRERAAALLLGQIQRDDKPPSDDEVFRAMEVCRLGMEEAAKSVTVSRALRRARQEQGLSEVEAIDNLTSQLSLSSLARKVSSANTLPSIGSTFSVGAGPCCSATLQTPNKSSAEGSDSGSAGVVCELRSSSTPKKLSLQAAPWTPNSAKLASNTKASSTKPTVRKRSILDCEEPVKNTTVSKKDGNDIVELELSKKAQIAGEVSKSTDLSIRAKTPGAAIVRNKRSASQCVEEQQLHNPQPPKRPRADSEL